MTEPGRYARRASITGAVARVEAQWSHKAFLDAATPRFAMTKVDEARKLIKRGETAASYFPDETAVITTSTIRDHKRDVLPWEDNDYRRGELDIIEEFGPDYHIPADYSDYADDSAEKREENIQKCITGTLWMQRKLADAETDIIPLMKGCRPVERQTCYNMVEDQGFDQVALYVANYYSTAGNHIERIVEDLGTITDEMDWPLLLIGCLAPSHLARLPQQVAAGAGQTTWREPVAPRKQNATAIRNIYTGIESEVADALGQPDPLDEHTPLAAEPGAEPTRE
jgi:hypothetical protein